MDKCTIVKQGEVTIDAECSIHIDNFVLKNCTKDEAAVRIMRNSIKILQKEIDFIEK